MEANLYFNIGIPEERLEFERALSAEKVIFAVWEFLHNSHRGYEHNDDKLYEGFIEAQDQLRSLLDHAGVSIDSLVE